MGFEIRHKGNRTVLLEIDADTLEGANLAGTNLAAADLFRANLFAARLESTNLEFADLCGADLRRAVLTGANLTRANLYGADLGRADLRRTDLTRAILSCADLRRAIYDNRTRWPAGFDVAASEALLGGSPQATGRPLTELTARQQLEVEDEEEADPSGQLPAKVFGSAAPGAPDPGRGIGPARPVLEIPLEMLDRDPRQPRKRFDKQSLQSLANSIASQGLLQPIVVRPGPEGRFHIVAGERRYRACRILGLPTITAIVHNFAADRALLVALVENLHRDDLTDIEKSDALVHLKEITGDTWGQLGAEIHLSVDRVKALAGLQALAEPVKEMVRTGRLSGRQARAIRPLPAEEQETLAIQAAEQALSAETIRRRVQERLGRTPAADGASEDDGTEFEDTEGGRDDSISSRGPVATDGPGASSRRRVEHQADVSGTREPAGPPHEDGVPGNTIAPGADEDAEWVAGRPAGWRLRSHLREAIRWLRQPESGEPDADLRSELLQALDELRILLVDAGSG